MSIKRISKIVTVLVIIATILSAFSMVFASGTSSTGGTITIPKGNNPTSSGLTSTVSNVIGIVQFICYAAAVILIVILGIKFMTAAPDAKAEIKKSAVIYVVGAVLVFAAGLLLNLIKNVAESSVKAS